MTQLTISSLEQAPRIYAKRLKLQFITAEILSLSETDKAVRTINIGTLRHIISKNEV
jgi:hypothetical protein